MDQVGTMHLEERCMEKEGYMVSNLGGALFNSPTQLYHLPILLFFWISQPMHGVSLWRQQNERK